MANFELAYTLTLKSEGLYSTNSADRGGETWKGISRNRWPDWEGWKLIDEIKANCAGSQSNLIKALQYDEELEMKVREFFLVEFWEKLNFEKIGNDWVACELFDTAVNQGSGTAVKYFQQALNMLNDNQKHFRDIEADGIIGPGTLAAFDAYLRTASIPGRSVDLNIKILVMAMNGLQFERYKEIVQRDPGQEAFFYGWIQRT